MNFSNECLLYINPSKDYSTKDYSPGGMVMPGRNFSYENYGFGFNGKLKDDEVKGSGNSYDFGARIYDPRLGRWLSIDPLQKKYPFFSPYVFSASNPILFYDFDGRDFDPAIVNQNGSATNALIAFVGHLGLNYSSASSVDFVATNYPPCHNCNAITLYPKVYYKSAIGIVIETTIKAQVELAAHEMFHYDEIHAIKVDFGSAGIAAWYSNYLVEEYEGQPTTETYSYNFEDLASFYLEKEFNGEENYLLNVFSNKDLSDKERADMINIAFSDWEKVEGGIVKFNPVSSSKLEEADIEGKKQYVDLKEKKRLLDDNGTLVELEDF